MKRMSDADYDVWTERFAAGMRSRDWEIVELEARVKDLEAQLADAREWRAAVIAAYRRPDLYGVDA